MKVVILILCLALPMTSFAKNHPPAPYQQATLVSFHTISDGADCTSNGTITPPQYGTAQSTTQSTTNCYESRSRNYTLRIGSNVLVVESAIPGKTKARNAAIAIGTFGYGALFLKRHDVLKNQLPGAVVQIRSEGSGFRIKVGKKTGYYELVGAQ